MARWEPFNAVGGAYSDDARPWSVQDTVNYLVVQAERGGTRSPAILRGVPGMSVFCASMDAAPVRGVYNAEGRLFAVTGNTLYQIGTDGAATSLGTIPGVGRVTFAHNQITGGNQVVIANGQSGYVWDTVTETLTQITDDGFPGFKSVDFADQYIIGVEPFGRYWFHSDLSDAQSYNTLDRYTAEKSPDRIQQVIATGSDVFVLGERTAQFFYNTGAGTGTWANRQGAEMDRGAASPYTACRIDNTVIWLGDDGSVYRLNGYTAQRISTHALEQAISRSTLSDAFAFTFEDRGHKCYLLTFPDGRTWCYDAATGEWTRRESYGLDRWRANCLTKWQGVWIAGDYTNGKLYQLDWAVQTEAGEPLERRRTFPVLHDDQNKLLIPGLELVFDTGMDESSDPLPAPVISALTIAGDLADGNINAVESYQYVIAGGVLPRVVTILSGALPTGLSMDADGLVTGTRTVGGVFSWVVQVEDAEGNTATLADTSETIADPFWNNVVSLWRPTGSVGSSTITDEKPPLWGSPSADQKPLIATDLAAFDDTALAFDVAGIGDVTYTATAAGGVTVASPFGMGTGDFTYEGFVTVNATTGSQTIVQLNTISPSLAVQISSGQWRVFSVAAGTSLIAAAGTATASTRHFVQLRRTSGVLELRVDGSLIGSAAHTFDYSTAHPTYYGRQQNGSNPINGRLEMWRITKGVARDTAVPTRRFPNG